MYNTFKTKKIRTSISVNDSKEGEPIEIKIARLTQNGGGNEETAEPIYQENIYDIQAAYDIRADRMAIAMEANDKGAASIRAKRSDKMAAKVVKLKEDATTEQPKDTTNQSN